MRHDNRLSARQRGYTAAWDKARAAYLSQFPLCVMCAKTGLVTVATVVDHIIPHKGDMQLFWDKANNWQSLCAPHHNGDKQRIDKGGSPRPTIGLDGWPITQAPE